MLSGTLAWGETLSFPTSGVAITSATLNISISPYGSGQAEIDATVQVLWKPTWEQIPSTTRALTVSVDGGPAMVLKGVRKIAPFARLFSRLSNVEPDLPSCPPGFDPQTAAVKLTGARGRTIGALTIDDLGECNKVLARLGRRRGAPLWDHGLLDLLWREGGVNTCRPSQLTSTIKLPTSNRARSIDIEMKNTSSIECSVDGYPKLSFLTPQHRTIEVRLARDRRHSKASLATAVPGGVLIITATGPKHRPRCPTRTIESVTIGLPRIAGELHASANRPVSICAGPITTSPVFNPGPFSVAF
ncbi:MAG: DUF4232 domain-containing protein [Solirubrobacterales bacterium]|nr:DUF4232 domain-containing protein [Solirubrobacterales bacterium]